MKYLASRPLWNLQTLKAPDTNSWVVPSPRFKFQNRDLRCTIHRNKPRLECINSIRIHVKSSHSFSSLKSVEHHRKVTVWDMPGKMHTWPNCISKISREPSFSHCQVRKIAPICFQPVTLHISELGNNSTVRLKPFLGSLSRSSSMGVMFERSHQGSFQVCGWNQPKVASVSKLVEAVTQMALFVRLKLADCLKRHKRRTFVKCFEVATKISDNRIKMFMAFEPVWTSDFFPKILRGAFFCNTVSVVLNGQIVPRSSFRLFNLKVAAKRSVFLSFGNEITERILSSTPMPYRYGWFFMVKCR